MASNAQKTHLAVDLNRFAQQKVLSVMQLTGKALPCSVVLVSGSIVTVKFEVQSTFTLPVVTMPVFGPEYIRYPVQVGDLGVTVAADAYLGGVSGLGGGVASLATPANLSALFFMPVASTKWSPSEDPNAVVIYGPDGVIIRTVDKAHSITVSPTGIVIKGNTTIQGNLVTTGTTTSQQNISAPGASINGVNFNSHFHPDPQGGNSGPPQS